MLVAQHKLHHMIAFCAWKIHESFCENCRNMSEIVHNKLNTKTRRNETCVCHDSSLTHARYKSTPDTQGIAGCDVALLSYNDRRKKIDPLTIKFIIGRLVGS